MSRLIQRAGKTAVMFSLAVLLTGLAAAPAAAKLPSAMEGNKPTSFSPGELETFADQFFTRNDVQSKDVPGAAVVVVHNGKIKLAKGYGYADVASHTPVDPGATVFRVGSIAKAVTATAVMQLVEQGKIGRHQDIRPYLDGMPLTNPFPAPVTMEHLLTHTTGFDFTEPRLGDIDFEGRPPVALRDYIADRMPSVVRPPGESYNYDNFASMLQGFIVQQLTGVPFHQYAEQAIFHPLQMKNSGFVLTPAARSKLATGYDDSGRPLPPYTTVPEDLPQGGMYATAEDMAAFMIAHLQGGVYGKTRILRQSTADDMHRIHFSLHPKVPVMAYGFDTSNRLFYQNERVIAKGGNIQGFSSKMWLLPDRGTGLFIAVNQRSDVRDLWFRAFMERFYPQTPQADTFISLPPAKLARLEGVYVDLRSKISLTRVTAGPDGTLIVDEPKTGRHRLRAIDELYFKDADGQPLVFRLKADGSVGYLQYLYELSTSQKINVPQPFPDVPEDSAYTPYIEQLHLLGLVQSGVGGAYGSSAPITRGEFAALAAKSLFMALSQKAPIFADMAGSPYAASVQTLYEMGVVKRTSDGLFHPERIITRQEAAFMMAATLRLGGLPPLGTDIRVDADAWALDSVRLIAALGLYGPEVTRLPDGTLDYGARRPMLRQEAAVLIAKALAD